MMELLSCLECLIQPRSSTRMLSRCAHFARVILCRRVPALSTWWRGAHLPPSLDRQWRRRRTAM